MLYLTDPCDTFILLNEAWRSPSNENSLNLNCDDTLATGWYRFQLNSSNAQMLTTCPSIDYICGTQWPIWFNGDTFYVFLFSFEGNYNILCSYSISLQF